MVEDLRVLSKRIYKTKYTTFIDFILIQTQNGLKILMLMYKLLTW